MSFEVEVDVIGGAYLQEALGVLQQVQAAVAAVVLLRNPTVGAPHGVWREEARRSPVDLPLHLQVAEERKSRFSQLIIKNSSISTVGDDSEQKRLHLKPNTTISSIIGSERCFIFLKQTSWRSEFRGRTSEEAELTL